MDGGIGESMLLGAALGGGTSALTGGDPLKGALMGGLGGGVGYGAGLWGDAATSITPGMMEAGNAAVGNLGINGINSIQGAQSALQSGLINPEQYSQIANAWSTAAQGGGGFLSNLQYGFSRMPGGSGISQLLGGNAPASTTQTVPAIAPAGGDLSQLPQGVSTAANIGGGAAASPQVAQQGMQTPWYLKSGQNEMDTSSIKAMWGSLSPAAKAAAIGAGGLGIYGLMSKKPNYLTPYQPPTAESYGLGRTLSSSYTPWRPYNAGGSVNVAPLHVGPGSVASGGVAPVTLKPAQDQAVTMGDLQDMASQYGYSLPTTNMADGGIAGLAESGNFPMSQQQNPRYAVASQMPASAEATRMQNLPPVPMAAGGHLGGYSDGGRMLKGPGDGMSDSIPASISGKQPARLADGEFVVPADVVSHLGNGSTDAGAKQLYKMMDKVRTARTGRKSQGKQINPKKYIPA